MKRIRTIEQDPGGGWIARNPFTGEDIFEPGFRWNSRSVARCVVEEARLLGPQDASDCKRCAGNGEIVTDWALYLHPPEGAPDDAGTADCPDCGGTGKAVAAHKTKANL